jgi:glycosyltransferase involved in cell wall biosynthesis
MASAHTARLQSEPMLSFLVPAYDCADVVPEAVESALAQRIDEDLELVAVDDCSPDRTHDVLGELAARDDRVRVLRHDHNQGGGPARNTAAKNARGELLYVLDADNVLPEGCVQLQLDVMRRTGAGAVSVGTQQFFDGATGEHRHVWHQASDAGWSTLRHAFESLQVPAAHGNYLFSRKLFDAVDGYDSHLGAMDTWSFGFKHLAHGFDVAIAEDAHYLHRIDRPDHDSYWTRDQRLGQNDRNALEAIRRERELLPDDLAAKVDLLEPGDPFFDAVSAGAFRRSVDEEEFLRIVQRARHARSAEPSVATRLRTGVGRLLRR